MDEWMNEWINEWMNEWVWVWVFYMTTPKVFFNTVWIFYMTTRMVVVLFLHSLSALHGDSYGCCFVFTQFGYSTWQLLWLLFCFYTVWLCYMATRMVVVLFLQSLSVLHDDSYGCSFVFTQFECSTWRLVWLLFCFYKVWVFYMATLMVVLLFLHSLSVLHGDSYGCCFVCTQFGYATWRLVWLLFCFYTVWVFYMTALMVVFLFLHHSLAMLHDDSYGCCFVFTKFECSTWRLVWLLFCFYTVWVFYMATRMVVVLFLQSLSVLHGDSYGCCFVFTKFECFTWRLVWLLFCFYTVWVLYIATRMVVVLFLQGLSVPHGDWYGCCFVFTKFGYATWLLVWLLFCFYIVLVFYMATRMVVVLFLHSLSVLHGDSYGCCFVFTKFECSTWRLVWLLFCFYKVWLCYMMTRLVVVLFLQSLSVLHGDSYGCWFVFTQFECSTWRLVWLLFCFYTVWLFYMATRMVVVLFLHSLSVLHGDSYGCCFVFTQFECSTWRLVWLLFCFYKVWVFYMATRMVVVLFLQSLAMLHDDSYGCWFVFTQFECSTWRLVWLLFCFYTVWVFYMATRMVVVLFLHSLSVLHGDSYGCCFVFTQFECSTWRLVWLLFCFYTVWVFYMATRMVVVLCLHNLSVLHGDSYGCCFVFTQFECSTWRLVWLLFCFYTIWVFYMATRMVVVLFLHSLSVLHGDSYGWFFWKYVSDGSKIQ